uniref:JmjC domain-containing protein n=1 Tax=Macrostomum lignano TaxID=282301 RepID=A0A1I8IJX3_9PLAT
KDRGNKIYNVLSLEISETRLSSTVVPPKPVRDLSLVNRCWPDESGHLSGEDCPEDDTRNKPEVLKFCLMSADFHIDFGGSSVWYHILWGEKIFYLIPPSDVNLDRYESWMESPDNLTEFLGDRCPAIHEMEQRFSYGAQIPIPNVRKAALVRGPAVLLNSTRATWNDQALPEFSHVGEQCAATWYRLSPSWAQGTAVVPKAAGIKLKIKRSQQKAKAVEKYCQTRHWKIQTKLEAVTKLEAEEVTPTRQSFVKCVTLNSSRSSMQQQSQNLLQAAHNHQPSTAKQRLGKKLGLFKSSR